jgi:ubiquitin C-terminal hydrolase
MEGQKEETNINKIIDPNIKKGFTNFGNTCFYNATLQCLFRLMKLINKLKDYKEVVQILPDGSTETKPVKSKLLKYLQITIEDYYLKPQVDEIGPVLLLRSYREMNQGYIGGTQDCARECLTYFIDNFIDASKQEDIHIAELFDCDLKSEITCPLCNNKTESNAPEKVINLPIKDQTTFEGSMNQFLHDEKLDDDNMYNCEKCNQKVNANKKLIIKKR